MPTPSPDANGLDAALVLGAMLIIGGGLAMLGLHDIPDKNLPIFASILTGLVTGILGSYAGFRWGSSVTAKRMAGQQGAGE